MNEKPNESPKGKASIGEAGNDGKRNTNNKRWYEYPRGFDRLAVWTAEDPDKSTTIYRRFGRLNAYNLLHMEAELASLEDDLDANEDEISELLNTWAHSNDSAEWQTEIMTLRRLGQDWDFALAAANGKLIGSLKERNQLENIAKIRVRNVLEVRNKLKEYHEALELSDGILNFSSPNRRTLKAARKLFGSGSSALLRGSSERRFVDNNDLCVLSRETKTDPLTKLFEGYLAFIFRSKHGDVVLHRNVDFAVSVISVVLSAAFLLGAVLALYFITNPNAQLGVLSGFVGAFALILALLTNARRQEVFTATAAYAAVLVVFVGADFGSTSGNSTSTNSKPATSSASSTLTRVLTRTETTSLTSTQVLATSTLGSIPNVEKGLSAGAVAGIVIGSAITGALLGSTVMFFLVRSHRKSILRRYEDKPESYSNTKPLGAPIELRRPSEPTGELALVPITVS